jgi:hypothetical protein
MLLSDPVQLALIASLTTIIPSMVSAFFAYKASVHAKRAVDVAQKTEENTNHMKDELVALTAKSSHAEGVIEGKNSIQEKGQE